MAPVHRAHWLCLPNALGRIVRNCTLAVVTAGSLLAANAVAETQPSDEPAPNATVESIQKEIEAIRDKLSEYEQLKQRLAELEKKLETVRQPREQEVARAESEPQSEPEPKPQREPEPEPSFQIASRELHYELSERIKRMEANYATTSLAKPEGIKLGGALWLNYALRGFDEADKSRGGEFNFDLFRVAAEGSVGDVLFSAQYRFYSFMDVIHHGWLGYNFGESWQTRIGVTKVPFGTMPFASHSYWFGVPYYVGLEDDYDTGIKIIHDKAPWNLQLAFFKNGEWGNADKLERYSFDVVRVPGQQQFNEETNQFNLRLARTLKYDDDTHTEIGVSAQWGQLYNSVTDSHGDRWAAAVHLDHFSGPWNAQLQFGRYEFNPENPAGVSNDLIEMGAFTASRAVAAEGDLLVANLARDFAVNWGPIKTLTCYNDYSRLFKDRSDFADSELNTLGCRIPAGRAYTFVDLILGRNTTFLDDSRLASGLGPGSDGEWKTRFNINFEYYF